MKKLTIALIFYSCSNLFAQTHEVLLRPIQEITISFPYAGTLSELFVKEGDTVNKNDLLAEQENQESRLELERNTVITNRKEQEHLATLNLYNKKMTSKEDFLNKEIEYRLSLINTKLANHNLKRKTLYSPISGKIEQINYNIGEWIQPDFKFIKIINTTQIIGEILLTP